MRLFNCRFVFCCCCCCCCFFYHTAQCFCTSMSKTRKIIVPWLISLFTSRFLFLNTPCPMFLWRYVQGTCYCYSIVNETVSHLFLLHSIQCFCGYMSKAPATVTPLLMRLFHIKFIFNYTPSSVSAAICPKHQQQLCQINESFSLPGLFPWLHPVQYFCDPIFKTLATIMPWLMRLFQF